MKKLLISLGMILLIMVSTGCATWEGIKEDSTNAYDSTKEANQNATN